MLLKEDVFTLMKMVFIVMPVMIKETTGIMITEETLVVAAVVLFVLDTLVMDSLTISLDFNTYLRRIVF